MNKDELTLLTMLNDNKISEQEYQMLIAALNKKSFCTQIENSLLVNPFQKIAGIKALLLGIPVLMALSIMGVYAEVYFDSVLWVFDSSNITLKEMKPNFLLLLYQNGMAWLTLSFVFIGISKILRLKSLRIIDFLGTTALARFPMLLPLTVTSLEHYLTPEYFKIDASKSFEFHFSFLGSINELVFLVSFAWVLMTYLFAFKESSGAEGKKLWFGYVTAMLLGNSMAGILTRWFLYA